MRSAEEANRLGPDQQLSELAEILAAGLIRLISQKRRTFAESSHGPVETREFLRNSASQGLAAGRSSGLSVHSG